MQIIAVRVLIASLCQLVCAFANSSALQQPLSADQIDSQAIIVSTKLGDIRGVRNNETITFKGIPYAQAPVGNLRWRSARPVDSWSGIQDARDFGRSCVQKQRVNRPVNASSEDCLNLNIWAPPLSNVKSPVMVWIHGGAFRFGSGSQSYFDGTEFAKSGVVLVSINYRLGRFGFFSHPALDDERDTVNFGLSDQIQALKWVRENIQAFGGDPDNITIFGESAGAVSVAYHLTMDAARGLFDKAILQSGGGAQIARYAQKPRGRKNSLRHLGKAWAQRQNLGQKVTAVELRLVSSDRVLETSKSQGGLGAVNPVIDGVLVFDDIATRFANGKAAPVPIITGSNSFEGSLLRLFKIKPKFVLLGLGKRRLEANRAYQVRQRSISKTDLALEVFGDGVFSGPARDMAIHTMRHNNDAYVYSFDYRKTTGSEIINGAHHGWEIPFVFKTLSSAPELFGDEVGRETVAAMAETMHQYWVNFAYTGNPNTDGLPDWPKVVTNKMQKTLILENNGPRVATDFRKREFDFQGRVYRDRLGRNQN